MLRFFRKLRRQLIKEGHVKNYVLYTLGEILLVVIGILIALQINSWNEQAKDRAAEKIYLNSIKDDLVTDTTNLNLVLDQVALNLDAMLTLINLINHSSNGPLDTVKIYHSIRIAGFLMQFEPNAATFDDLKSTGNSRIIRNLDLKKKIGQYYTHIESKKSFRNLWQQKVWGDYWRERNHLINDQLNAFWSNAFYQGIVDIDLPRAFDWNPENHKAFLQTLYSLVDIATFRRSVFMEIKEMSKDLLEDLSEEIEKH